MRRLKRMVDKVHNCGVLPRKLFLKSSVITDKQQRQSGVVLALPPRTVVTSPDRQQQQPSDPGRIGASRRTPDVPVVKNISQPDDVTWFYKLDLVQFNNL
ncbi:hypothetical protein F2P81_021666 [Scophthalmus maximus]|uniref:Uncharacterized protein n=1 Tax=Scophthalmus maximus TaxID=52904 RepID=A0A6A4S338_SCOMX|nr:hypothetical protein F2P81_021666 [Scophthalmus maximus]